MQTATHTSDTGFLGQLTVNRGFTPNSEERPLTASGGGRLTCYVDYTDSEQNSVSGTVCATEDSNGMEAEEGMSTATPTPPMRIAFDTLGMTKITEEMLQELYEAFDVNGSGGVERDVMRVMMRNCFSNYGAPISETTLDSIFEKVTPFRLRRRVSATKAEGGDSGIMSFNEFCVLFLGWLRL